MEMRTDYSEQRRFPRFSYSVPIKYREQDQTVPAYSVIRDISVGGLKILTNHFIRRGAEIQVEVAIPRVNTINASGTVVWSNRINHSEEYLCGLKFSEINETCRKNITDLVSYALKH